jgi:hypothetical protein
MSSIDYEMRDIGERRILATVAILKPRLFMDGAQWCYLLGENIQEGVVGFGYSPFEAAKEFFKEYHRSVKPVQIIDPEDKKPDEPEPEDDGGDLFLAKDGKRRVPARIVTDAIFDIYSKQEDGGDIKDIQKKTRHFMYGCGWKSTDSTDKVLDMDLVFDTAHSSLDEEEARELFHRIGDLMDEEERK